MAEWAGRTATEIAAAVRAGQVTARDVTTEHLDRIAKVNPELGAFVRVRSAEAVKEAAEIDARADRAELRLAARDDRALAGCAVDDAKPYLADSRLERRTRRHTRAGQVMMRVRPTPRYRQGTAARSTGAILRPPRSARHAHAGPALPGGATVG